MDIVEVDCSTYFLISMTTSSLDDIHFPVSMRTLTPNKFYSDHFADRCHVDSSVLTETTPC